MDLRICGTIILAICAICGTVLTYKKLDNRYNLSMTWAEAFDKRCDDRNAQERKNWSATNCDLAAMVELLRNENEQYKKTLAMAGVEDVAEFRKWLEGRK